MSDQCTHVNGWGLEYTEFSCLYPILEPLYTPWEKGYNPRPVLDWMAANGIVPVVACTLYFCLIFAGQSYMKDKEAWKWRKILAVWNLLLSSFSFIGAMRTAPQLLHNLATLPFRENLCGDPRVIYGSGSSGLWVQLFVLSKFPELLDTFFIVIHKKPLIFLHWYHHITVLLYCWHSYANPVAAGLFFTAMNYSVHAIMYGYYFLMAVRMKPKWMDPMIITVMQIAQMIVGVTVTFFSFYYYITDSQGTCLIQKENNIAAFVMYGSYLFLFMQFFIGRYYKGHVKMVKKKTA